MMTPVKYTAQAPLAPEAIPKPLAALQSASGACYDLEVASGQLAHGTVYAVCTLRWEVVEAAAGAPVTHGATLPTGVTGPQVS